MNVPDTFQEKVNRQVERFQRDSLAGINIEVSKKRIDWFKQHYPAGVQDATPRRAYEILFLEYMGLNPADVPVCFETKQKIVWLSHNPCQTLEACKILGMDTRQVCRAAFEESTQVLIALIDPHLRFGRSYDEIRPFAPHCREWIQRETNVKDEETEG